MTNTTQLIEVKNRLGRRYRLSKPHPKTDHMPSLQQTNTTNNDDDDNDDQSDIQSTTSHSTLHTLTPSFTSSTLSRPPQHAYRSKVYRHIHFYDKNHTQHTLEALFDTGASVNCISEAKAWALRLGKLRRKLPCSISPRAGEEKKEEEEGEDIGITGLELEIADGRKVGVGSVVKGRWRVIDDDGRDWGKSGRKRRNEGYDRGEVYSHLFYVVPGLPQDVIICRQAIFEHCLFGRENYEFEGDGRSSTVRNVDDGKGIKALEYARMIDVPSKSLCYPNGTRPRKIGYADHM